MILEPEIDAGGFADAEDEREEGDGRDEGAVHTFRTLNIELPTSDVEGKRD